MLDNNKIVNNKVHIYIHFIYIYILNTSEEDVFKEKNYSINHFETTGYLGKKISISKHLNICIFTSFLTMSPSLIQIDKIFSQKKEMKPQKCPWENRYSFENIFGDEAFSMVQNADFTEQKNDNKVDNTKNWNIYVR